ncbi:MAG: energy transducer TonB [Bryobacteraceae bacterium]|jgi:protein TonB
MTPHADILDQPEPLGKSLAGSVALHISVAAALLTSTWIGRRLPVEWGDINGGGMGSVAVNVVPRIPMPGRSGPINPVANDTESVVPTPPPKAKPRPKAEAPEPNAIAIKSRNAEKKASRAASAPNKFREQQQDLPNQLYSTSGQAVVSPMYGMTGGGGVGIGTSSPFGAQFGWYVNLLRDQVARNWRTSDLDPRLRTAPQVWVTFTIRRDGSVTPGSVKITQRSGNPALDYSALRAILDAAPFQPLPPQFQRNEVEIEFRFELRR